MEDHRRYDTEFAATTNRRAGGNTMVIVLSILLVVALLALGTMAWLHFSPMLFHSGTPGTPGQVTPKHHW